MGKIVYLACCMFLLFGASACSSYANKSEADIRKELLHNVPLGSSSKATVTYLRRKTGKAPEYKDGVISSTVANYWSDFLISTKVYTTWKFDTKDRLIDLEVEKWGSGM